ncbi:cytochrome P450 CYP99A1-like [Triticum dicoccoides]|uniref:cytochrome P450 CYP99A1-like n=1 Tax=Triticum dicoccoides TaxID=85692 RepID=UPI000E7D055A|nr:cytochrome P450 CYP99A1-like [Triticum dicoccoides]
MELSAATVFLSVVSLVILVFFLSRKTSASSKKKRPPGPWCLPLIGNLLHLLTSQPQAALRDLARKHGPVMSLRLGQVDAVVISSPAAAQEVLRDKDLTFASRPSMLTSDIILYGNMDIAFAPYGAYWRMLRKLCMVELLSAQKVRQLAPVRDGETRSLVRKVGTVGRGGEPVNLGRLLCSCSISITAKATFGRLCDEELQKQYMPVVEVAVKEGGGFSAGDLFPSLWFVDVATGLTRRLWRTRRQLDAIFDKMIAECEAQRAEKKKTTATTKTTGDEEEHLLNVLLRIKDEGKLEVPISMTSIKAILFDMLTGGTETTSSAAEWIMSELMRNPEAMAKAQAEVRRTFDGKSPEDHEGLIDKLRYMKMVIKEGLRLNPVLPLLLPRLCGATCDIGGYEVAKGTKVIVNAWAMARSPEHWPHAEEFRPERFDGGVAGDFKGLQFEYLPFGSGRRMCPGDTFGLAVLELIVARLFYYFDWSLPNGMRPDELDMDMIVGSTARRKNQLHLLASPCRELPVEI